MGELASDIAASNHHDASRQLVQFQELFTIDQVLNTRKGDRPGIGAGGNEDITRLQRITADLEPIPRHEPSAAMVTVDPLFSVTPLLFFPYYFRAGSL